MKTKLVNSLVSLSNIEVTLTYNQYLAYKNNDLSLVDIKFINHFDKELGVISKNPQIYKFIVGGCAFIMASSSSIPVYAEGNLSTIPALGLRIYTIIQEAMKWICLIKASVDIGREISRGGDNGSNIVRIILKYLMAFAALYLLPELFNIIEDNF